MEGRSLFRGGLFLLALSLVRVGVDRVRDPGSIPSKAETELPQLLEASRTARDDEERRSAPFSPGETVDPNRSGEEELDRLPGVGPSTARAMIADREEKGGFVRPEDLLRVPGIGPATLTRLRPFLDFSRGVPLELHRNRPNPVRPRTRGDRRAGSTSPGSPDSATRQTIRVDLNRASSDELQTLPGIGPALAERILESRLREGPFHRPEDLLRVRGIGPATLSKLRALITPRG